MFIFSMQVTWLQFTNIKLTRGGGSDVVPGANKYCPASRRLPTPALQCLPSFFQKKIFTLSLFNKYIVFTRRFTSH